MIRFRISELIAEKQFRDGRRITIKEVADETSINRMTLSRMLNHKGYSTVTENLDRLCAYFECALGDLAVYIPDQENAVTKVTEQPHHATFKKGQGAKPPRK